MLLYSHVPGERGMPCWCCCRCRAQRTGEERRHEPARDCQERQKLNEHGVSTPHVSAQGTRKWQRRGKNVKTFLRTLDEKQHTYPTYLQYAFPWPLMTSRSNEFFWDTCSGSFHPSTRNSPSSSESSASIHKYVVGISLVSLSPDAAGVGGRGGSNGQSPADCFIGDSDWFFGQKKRKKKTENRREERESDTHRDAVGRMASLIGKAVRGKRSGDGREGRSARLERAASIPGRSTGAGWQAKAWSTTSFEKLKGTKDLNNCSSSTSPETDPGASSVFPFFTGTAVREMYVWMLGWMD